MYPFHLQTPSHSTSTKDGESTRMAIRRVNTLEIRQTCLFFFFPIANDSEQVNKRKEGEGNYSLFDAVWYGNYRATMTQHFAATVRTRLSLPFDILTFTEKDRSTSNTYVCVSMKNKNGKFQATEQRIIPSLIVASNHYHQFQTSRLAGIIF
jgi:hypothetical protein